MCDVSLWASVILQTKADVEDLPVDSVDYNAAASFFTSDAAYWRRGRAEIAEHLGTTGETLRRLGTAWVIARRRNEGLPDLPPAPAPKQDVVRAANDRARRHVEVERRPLVIPPALAAFLRPAFRRAA